MKITFIATVLNEEKTIGELLRSIDEQTKKPDEVIVVDGGSTDATTSVISNFKFQISNLPKVKFYVKKGNRSEGRNFAIKKATSDIMVISDAGCVLDKDWVKNIVEPFKDSKVSIIAGYYKGIAKNSFEKCVIPYFLVMPDKLNPNHFLPATRSMAIRKKVFEKVGRFNENLSLNEDFEFAKRLEKQNVIIKFAKNAIVFWTPPSSIISFYNTIYRFARGDVQAKILRPKVIILFSRYLLLFQLFVMLFGTGSIYVAGFLVLVAISYVFFAVKKNYRYAGGDPKAFFYLPLLQLISDFAVIGGTIRGGRDLWVTRKQS